MEIDYKTRSHSDWDEKKTLMIQNCCNALTATGSLGSINSTEATPIGD